MSTEVFDGFIQVDYGTYRLRHWDFEARPSDRARYKLYAMLGLHRYNLLEGKNFTLHRMKNYNNTFRVGPSNFFITLTACDPKSSREKTFQVEVDEGGLGYLDLSVPIARPLSSKKKPVLYLNDQELYDNLNGLYGGTLPKWPLALDFKEDKRFYTLEKKDFEDNDWIRLYLEVLVSACHYNASQNDVSNLKIGEVVIEATGDAKEKLNAERVILYIRFSGALEPEGGLDGNHKAIIRRVINKRTRFLTLLGRYWSGNVDESEMWDIESVHMLPDSEKQQTKKGKKRTAKIMTCGESSNVPAKQTKKGKKSRVMIS